MSNINRKTISILAIIALLIAISATVYLVSQRQELRKRAAVPGGNAVFHINGPSTAGLNDTVPIDITLKTPDTPKGVTGVKATLTVTSTGDNPLTITEEDIQEKFPSPWSLRKEITTSGTTTTILVEAVYLSAGVTGYRNTVQSEETFVTLNFKADKQGTATLRFVPEKSEVRSKDQNLDVLNIELESKTITITQEGEGSGGQTPTATITPSSGSNPPNTQPTDTPVPTSPPDSGGINPTTPPSPTTIQAQPTAIPTTVAINLTNFTNGQIFATNMPTFTGIAKPHAVISITIASNPITGETTANANGEWSWTSPVPIPAGSHNITVVATDNQGNQTTTTGTFTVQGAGTASGPSPTLPVTGSPVPLIGLGAIGVSMLLAGALFLF